MKCRMALVTALALVTAGAVGAQQRPPDRTELERQLRELQEQLQELRRQVRELEDRRAPMPAPGGRLSEMPRIRMPEIALFDRQARLGITVKNERDPATDSIGAAVMDVVRDGPADKAGIRAGDIITKLDGESLRGAYPGAAPDESEPGAKLIALARKLGDGDTVRVEYRRGKETRSATIVARRLGDAFGYAFSSDSGPLMLRLAPRIELPERRDVDREVIRGIMLSYSDSWLDIEMVTLNPDLGEYFGTAKGILVVRAPRDTALSLKSGDVILAVDGREATTPSQVLRALRSYEAGETIKVDVMRQKRKTTLTVKIPDRRQRTRERGFYREF